MSPSPLPEFRSNQYEFNDEQNRTISALSDGMRTAATLVQLLGAALLVFTGLTAYQAIKVDGTNWGPAAGFGAATLFVLTIGFWTGSAAHSFRRITETKNEDVWHLMNGLESLRNMYGLLRGIVMVCLFLTVVGIGLAAFALANRPA
jgi:uncharacterized membrane protein YbhN (UPF0104 family)